eukprot:scaffold98170_cov70-Attheya_sp.AAC.3
MPQHIIDVYEDTNHHYLGDMSELDRMNYVDNAFLGCVDDEERSPSSCDKQSACLRSHSCNNFVRASNVLQQSCTSSSEHNDTSIHNNKDDSLLMTGKCGGQESICLPEHILFWEGRVPWLGWQSLLVRSRTIPIQNLWIVPYSTA